MDTQWWGAMQRELVADVVPTAAGMRVVTEALTGVEITTEAAAIEVIAAAEGLKAAAAAVQVRATAVVEVLRRTREDVNGVPRARQGWGSPRRWRWHGASRRRPGSGG
ncbi:hypothetical protein [Georgenia sp. Z1491]|uniref:hypothetical protein n=1 Tax=Georgenia sp. Z1491 TaxID=3416707 RepID=UPI003CF19C98